MICNMIEIHNNATPFDAVVFVSSCDKAVPAHLMGVGKSTPLPSSSPAGDGCRPDLLTLEQIGMYSAMREGEITEEKLTWYKHHACPSCGACSLWELHPHHAGHGRILRPYAPRQRPHACDLQRSSGGCKKAGEQAVWLAKNGLKPKDMITMDSFENAIMVHAAISGSTNSCFTFRPLPMSWA